MPKRRGGPLILREEASRSEEPIRDGAGHTLVEAAERPDSSAPASGLRKARSGIIGRTGSFSRISSKAASSLGRRGPASSLTAGSAGPQGRCREEGAFRSGLGARAGGRVHRRPKLAGRRHAAMVRLDRDRLVGVERGSPRSRGGLVEARPDRAAGPVLAPREAARSGARRRRAGAWVEAEMDERSH